MLKFKPSETAAAAIWVARKACDASAVWTPTLVHYSGYSENVLEPCIRALQVELVNSIENPQQGVRRKYASVKLAKVSELPELARYIASLQ